MARNEEQVQLLTKHAQLIEKQARIIDEQAKYIAALKEKLRTNSSNSSTPPSSDRHRLKAPKPSTGKKRGAQPSHPGKARALLPPERVTHAHGCLPGPCSTCGGAVHITGLLALHHVIDLPPMAPLVTEYRLFAGACSTCGHVCEADLPTGVSARVTGARLLADLFGIELSVCAISEGEAGIGEALGGIVAHAHAHVQSAAVVHADETGHNECGVRHWLWLGATRSAAVFLAAATRSAQADRAALGEGFAGILVSDRYAAYAWGEAQHRQLCWAHLMGDFIKMAERSGDSGHIGDELLACARHMCACWHRVRDGTLSRKVFGYEMPFLRHRIETLPQEGVDCSHPRTARTCRQILKQRHALWTFLDTPGVEPTNNHAERTLRSFVIWRKNSFGTQSPRGSRYVERIMTAAGSCKRQDRNILDFLTQAIQAHRGHGKVPSLVPA